MTLGSHVNVCLLKNLKTLIKQKAKNVLDTQTHTHMNELATQVVAKQNNNNSYTHSNTNTDIKLPHPPNIHKFCNTVN